MSNSIACLDNLSQMSMDMFSGVEVESLPFNDYFFAGEKPLVGSGTNTLLDQTAISSEQPYDSRTCEPIFFDTPSPCSSNSSQQEGEYGTIQQLSQALTNQSSPPPPPPLPTSPAPRATRQRSWGFTRSDSLSRESARSNGNPASAKTKPVNTSSSRRSSAKAPRPAATRIRESSKTTHNMVEKQYRTRLNGQFDALLQTLPSELTRSNNDNDGRKVSKAEILVLAQRYIRDLEIKGRGLEERNNELRARGKKLERVWMMRGVEVS